MLAAADDAEDMGGDNLTARALVLDDKQPLTDKDGLPNVQARMPGLPPCPALPCSQTPSTNEIAHVHVPGL